MEADGSRNKTEAAIARVLDHVDAMIGYWAGEGGSNVSPDLPKREALEGLAFSLLVMLDGGAIDVPLGWLQPVDEDGTLGENIAGSLHELWSERRR